MKVKRNWRRVCVCYLLENSYYHMKVGFVFRSRVRPGPRPI